MAKIEIRPARREDGPAILSLERELARFESLPGPDETEGARLLAWIFDDHRFEALVAESEGRIAGAALYFYFPASFRARLGLYLEDIVVDPVARSGGVGEKLMTALAREAVSHNCLRMEWAVLPWNEGALKFYRRLGARPQSEWVRYFLDEPEIADLAG
jgi:GNAT superfamily N-acetyltransferase